VFSIVIVALGTGPRRVQVQGFEVLLGRARDCGVMLAGTTIAPHHAHIHVSGSGFAIDPLAEVHVGGRPITEWTVLQPADAIRIGEYTIFIEGAKAPDGLDDDPDHAARTDERMAIAEVTAAVEQMLIDAITRRDDGAWLVYSDWLEEQGDTARAEFLRLEESLLPLAPDYPALREGFERLRELAMQTDMAWRVLIARTPIDRCGAAKCPRHWGALAATDRTDVRICETCAFHVHYCAGVAETGGLRHRDPVVLDAVNARLDGSLRLNLMPRGPF
jgi:uncharacterized protein (TIGR02996 family)